ncbi:hypothetical protein COV61_00250 [Candidatus Micrarchaeota archaeon CG11_big_fil_rev_8_21_14_0_20_47_5]|nr:MAG: hypothetical protein AUJ17_04300 [Candidatus Micrarchaeota archaeon CG1_02_47_40]PIN84397.1 MAG: hypothetical protein COV61_00250 [Candidatus Micrarchaeota archaeon CG11_big_fil_rev_8_21_14_0_20_47_5]
MALLTAAYLLSQYGYLLALALFASISLVALLYMIGKFLSDERLEAYAKAELSQIFYSAIILLLVVFAATGTDYWVGAIASLDPQSAVLCSPIGPNAPQNPNLTPCHFALAKNHLDVVFDTAEDMSSKLIWMNSLFLFISEARIGLRFTIAPWGDLGMAPFSGISTLTEGINFAVDLLVKIMIVSRFQQNLLDIIQQSVFPIFLIGGFLLRNFFLTRKLGGLLLAMGVGLYFVFPFMYALAGYLLYATTGHTDSVLLFNGQYKTVIYNLELPQEEGMEKGEMKDVLNPDGGTIAPPNSSVYDLEGEALDDYIGQVRSQWDIFGVQEGEPQNILDTVGWIFTNLGEMITGLVSIAKSIPKALYDSLVIGGWYLGEEGVFAGIAKLMLFSVFMPFIAIMTTISAIKTLSPLLGGDVEIAGLTRLI